MDSGAPGQPGQAVTNPVDMESSPGRDSVTLQLLSMVGIRVLEKLLRLRPVIPFHVKVFIYL